MQASGRVPVRFDRPPVVEVACGVAFALPKPLKSAHIGLFWSEVLAEFPRCEDAPPIALVVEGKGPPDDADYTVQVEQMAVPPLRRAWLLNEPGTHLIQLQDDRFLFNWKRVSAESYPSYQQVIAGFRTQWARYKGFLADQNLGEPNITQLEMTYFNFWPAGDASFLRDHLRAPGDRFLPKSDAVNLKSLYTLPEGAGRLHIAAATARNVASGEKGIRMEITARGLPRDSSPNGCDAWFDLAHHWITHGFADATTPDAHKTWVRTA